MLSRLGNSYANVTATLALVVALGGTSYAAITLPKNSVSSKQIKPGAVKTAELGRSAVTSQKVKDRSLLSKDFKAGQLVAGAPGPQGPKGDKGEPGTNGTPGTPATVLWARVTAAGVLNVNRNATSASQPAGTGTYEVIFNQNVSACSFAVQPGGIGDFEGTSNFIYATNRSGNANGVFVQVKNASGTLVNSPFHLQVFC